MTLEAHTGPLMQFAARVGSNSACVRIKSNRIEWSMVGLQWVIRMAPMASITAVTSEPGLSKSNLVVTTTVGTADFCIEPETAEQARTLLMRLIANSAGQPDGAIDLINMKWNVGDGVIDPLEFDEKPARLLGL